MVLRTELCSFSEYRIYPGRGLRYYGKDGKGQVFISRKSKCFAMRKVKSQVIRWTVVWRRMHKKLKTEDSKKLKRRRAQKVHRDIVGISLEDIKNRRNERPEVRAAKAEEALREIKARKQKLTDDKKKQQKDGKVDKGAKKGAEKASQKQQKSKPAAKGKR